MGEKNLHIDKQKAYEKYAFNLILKELNIDVSNVSFEEEAPDIRFYYINKYIGLEVVDCYPQNSDIKTITGIEKLYEEIENVLTKKGFIGEYQLCFKDSIYKAKIKSIKNTIISDIEDILQGKELSSMSYVDSFNRCKIQIYTDRVKIHPHEPMRMLNKPSQKDLEECISKKNKLLTSYKKKNPNIDEFWLLIYIPTNIIHYSTNGIAPLEYVETDYKRIYVSDSLINGRLIYKQ